MKRENKNTKLAGIGPHEPATAGGDLFSACGLPPHRVRMDPHDLVAAFIRHVRESGFGSFNQFRFLLGVRDAPNWIGGLVAVACRRAGLIPCDTTKAAVPASRSRLCQVWMKPEGAGRSS